MAHCFCGPVYYIARTIVRLETTAKGGILARLANVVSFTYFRSQSKNIFIKTSVTRHDGKYVILSS